MVVRDQLVGPWQLPVADVAVTTNSYSGYGGEAMAMGERTPLALISSPAAARMAVGAIDIAAAPVARLQDIRLSANWMAASGVEGEDAKLYDAVRAVGMELCPELGISIPVGKDSMSMQTLAWWKVGNLAVVSHYFCIRALVDVRNTLTPELKTDVESVLVLLDLSQVIL